MQSPALVLDYAPPLRPLQRRWIQVLVSLLIALVAFGLFWMIRPKPVPPRLVPLKLNLPRPLFTCTPMNPPQVRPALDPQWWKPRPPFMVPPGCINLALNKPVTLSDPEPLIGEASFVTDGKNESVDGNWLEMAAGPQWVQIDLQQRVRIHAIVMWQCYAEPRIYRDVVLQVSDDPSFRKNVTTLFNNDHDNSSGLGAGGDRSYYESFEGRLVDGRDAIARYVRASSNGNTSNPFNQWTEIEVYGLPAPPSLYLYHGRLASVFD